MVMQPFVNGFSSKCSLSLDRNHLLQTTALLKFVNRWLCMLGIDCMSAWSML